MSTKSKDQMTSPSHFVLVKLSCFVKSNTFILSNTYIYFIEKIHLFCRKECPKRPLTKLGNFI